MTVNGKRILHFALVAPVCYGALVIAWPLVETPYKYGYALVGQTLFNGLVGANIEISPLDHMVSGRDVQIIITNPNTKARGRLTHSAYITGYLSTALQLSLIMATPLAWKRRGIALLLGLLLAQIFVEIRLLAALLHALGSPPPLGMLSAGPTITAIIDRAHELLAVSPMSGFIAPVVFWIIVCFRQSDIESFDADMRESIRQARYARD